jgi:hypothetical protein
MRGKRMTAITFTTDGIGHALYTEAIDLSVIGALEIQRATTIEFDNKKQRWLVKDGMGATVFSHASRLACLDWERDWLQRKEDARHELQHDAGATAAGARNLRPENHITG